MCTDVVTSALMITVPAPISTPDDQPGMARALALLEGLMQVVAVAREGGESAASIMGMLLAASGEAG
jgi:hypothetical protein